MAIRQYIGARYVLKIYENSLDPHSADWESGVAYEPLVMVNYNNSSYISRKDVPANIGNPVDNPSYWALSGLYNGQIAALQNSVNAINNLIGSGTLPHNENTIIDALNYLNAPYQYALWFGDSFVQANSLGADQDKRYSTLVSAMLGLTEKNYAAGGTGYITSTPTNYEQIQSAIIDFNNNNLDPNAVKYAFIGGFKNDGAIAFSDKWTYEAAIINCVTLINNNFPNAQVVLIPTASAFFLEENLLITLNFMEEACTRISGKAILIKDAYKWLMGEFNDILYQNNANVHPSVSGHQKIASHLYSELFGISLPRTSYVNVDPVWNAGIDSDNSVFTIAKADGLIHVFARFKVGASDLTGSTINIATRTNNSLYTADPYFIGRQTHIERLDVRYQSDLANIPMGKLTCQVTKDGDLTGTLKLILDVYNGTLKANETYKMDFIMQDNIRRLSADLA